MYWYQQIQIYDEIKQSTPNNGHNQPEQHCYAQSIH